MTGLRRIVATCEGLRGDECDIQPLIDITLEVAQEAERIDCMCSASGTALEFIVGLEQPQQVTVQLDHAASKLRAVCARWAVLVGDAIGAEPPLYGGEGLVESPAGSSKATTVFFNNTPDTVFFRVYALEPGSELTPRQSTEAQWDWLNRSISDPGLAAVVAEAATRPELRALFPFLSHDRLRFSRTVYWPYTFDCPYVQRLHTGEYLVRGGDNRPLGTTHMKAAVDLVMANLPKEVG